MWVLLVFSLLDYEMANYVLDKTWHVLERLDSVNRFTATIHFIRTLYITCSGVHQLVFVLIASLSSSQKLFFFVQNALLGKPYGIFNISQT